MAFLSTSELKILLPNCIEPYEEKRIENVAYELSLGSEVYLTDSKTGKPELLDEKNRIIEINPGQFALLLTKEKITIPKDKIAFISIKAGEKLKGLINVSGFHVDPGFSDKLLFSVYNAGPATIVLETNKPYFLIWFSELNGELSEEDAYNKKNDHYKKLDHIPTKYLEALKRGELTSPNVLSSKIKDNENSIKNNWWALGIILTLSITLNVKAYFDNAKYREIYDAGLKQKSTNEELLQAIKRVNIDSLVKNKIDSIMINNLKKDTL